MAPDLRQADAPGRSRGRWQRLRGLRTVPLYVKPGVADPAWMILSLAAADPQAPHGPIQGRHNTRRYSAPERLRPNQPPVLGPCKAPWWRPAVAWCAPGSMKGRRRGSLEGTARGSVCEFAAPSAWASMTGRVERGPILSSGRRGRAGHEGRRLVRVGGESARGAARAALRSGLPPVAR